MRRRQASLDLILNEAEFQSLKRLRRAPVDYREAPVIVEGVSVRGTVDLPGMAGVAVSLLLRVDEAAGDVEAAFRAALAEAAPPPV